MTAIQLKTPLPEGKRAVLIIMDRLESLFRPATAEICGARIHTHDGGRLRFRWARSRIKSYSRQWGRRCGRPSR